MKRRLATGLLCGLLIFQTAAAPVAAAGAVGDTEITAAEGAEDIGGISEEEETAANLPETVSGNDLPGMPGETEGEESFGETIQEPSEKEAAEGSSGTSEGSLSGNAAGDEVSGEKPSDDMPQGLPADPSELDRPDPSEAPSWDQQEKDSTDVSDEQKPEEDSLSANEVSGEPTEKWEEGTDEVLLTAQDIEWLESIGARTSGDGREYTPDEVKEIVGCLPRMHIFTNLSTVLSDNLFQDARYDSAAGKGWVWKRDSGIKDLKLTASDYAPKQIYTAVYRQPEYKELEMPLEVAVTKINKMTLVRTDTENPADSCLTQGHGFKAELRIKAVVTGSEVSDQEMESLFSVPEWKTSRNQVSITGDYKFQKEIQAGGASTDTVKATLEFAGVDKPKNNVTKFTCSYKVTAVDQPLADRFQIRPAASAANTNLKTEQYQTEQDASDSLCKISVDLEALKVSGNTTDMLELELLAYEKETRLDQPAVSWSTSNAGIASVRQISGRPVLILRKKGGTAVITATARDRRKHAQSFTVKILDHTPVLEETSFSLNKYKVTGENFTLAAMNGNDIKKVSILEYNKNIKDYGPEESGRFYIDHDLHNTDKDIWTLYLNSEAAKNITAKQSYNCMLRMETDRGSYERKIRITVSATKPSASLKVVSKLNLFRNDETQEGIYSISSKYEIGDVTWIPLMEIDPNGEEPYISGRYDSSSGCLIFSANRVTKKNYQELLKTGYAGRRGTIRVSFKDYDADYEFKTRAADVVSKEEAEYTVTPVSVCPSQGLIGRILEIREKDTGKQIFFGENDVLDPVSSGIELERLSNGRVEMTYKGRSSQTVKIRWDSPEYLLPVTLSVKVNVLPKVQFETGAATIFLNTEAKNSVTVPLAIQGTDYAPDEVVLTLQGKLKALSESGVIRIDYSEKDQQLRAELLKPEAFDRNAVYTLKISGKTAEKVKVADKILSVKIVTGTPAVKVSGKGSINLLERKQTCITYQPTLSNVSDSIERVKILGTSADFFDAWLDESGNVLVYAAEKAPLKASAKYQIRMQFTLGSGYQVTTGVISITPKEKKPGLKTNMKKAIVYSFGQEERRKAEYLLQVSGNSQAKIENIRLVEDKQSVSFDYIYKGNGSGTISLKKGSAAKAGTCKLSFQVYYKGKGITSKPVTVRLSVIVR